MKKQIIILMLISLALVGCNKKINDPVKIVDPIVENENNFILACTKLNGIIMKNFNGHISGCDLIDTSVTVPPDKQIETL